MGSFDVQKYLSQGRKHRVNHAWNFKPEDAIVLQLILPEAVFLNVLFAIMFFGTILTDTGQRNVIAEIKYNQKKYGANFLILG